MTRRTVANARPPEATAADAIVDRVTAEVARLAQPPAADGWLDPAYAVAFRMLIQAFEAGSVPLRSAAVRGEILVVILPSADWLDPCIEVWENVFLPRGVETACTENEFAESPSSPRAVFIAVSSEPTERDGKNRGRTFAEAVENGALVIGLSHEKSFLPRDLTAAASHSLRVGLLAPVGLAEVASHLCGGTAKVALTEVQATQVTPHLLRLAKRPGITTDRFLERLAALIQAKVLEQREVPEEKPTSGPSPRAAPTLDRLHGMTEAVAWGESLKRDLAAYRAGEIGWDRVDRGCLLSGPPGCGKTTFARALAASCGVRLVLGTYSMWLATGTGHQGDLLLAMRKTFSEARKLAPSIVFIDEIDSFPDRATVSHRYKEWEQQIVNALLAEIDGVEKLEGVVLVGACNFPDKLDPALVRAGRLDRHVRIGLPDAAGLALILREHLGGDAPDADLGRAALLLLGSTGADCESIVRGARRRARCAGHAMAPSDLFDEILCADGRTPSDLYVAAVHEAGHAAAAVENGYELRGVTIRARGRAGGGVSIKMPSSFLSAEDVGRRLIFLLAGRAAEEVMLGKPSSGAGGGPDSDLARATLLAASAMTDLALEAGTIAWTGAPAAADLSKVFQRQPHVAKTVEEKLALAYQKALDVARSHRTGIKALAQALVERGALNGSEAMSLLRAQPPHGVAEAPGTSRAPHWLLPLPPKSLFRASQFAQEATDD
jgi:hypothetical protein